MLLIFDVDCGELVPGHHFIARGLGGPFRTSTLDRWETRRIGAELTCQRGHPADSARQAAKEAVPDDIGTDPCSFGVPPTDAGLRL
jgi:hypothetical protein